jgi:hypothetical protein
VYWAAELAGGLLPKGCDLSLGAIMATALDRLLAVVFGMAFVALAVAAVVWLPGWWGLLFAPALIWLGWLLVEDVIKSGHQITPDTPRPVSPARSGNSEEHPRRKMAA